jgi:hypothetical protein
MVDYERTTSCGENRVVGVQHCTFLDTNISMKGSRRIAAEAMGRDDCVNLALQELHVDE